MCVYWAHSDTTYRCYAQIKSDKAIEDLNNLFLPKEAASNINQDLLREHPDSKTFLILGENISAG
jgi:hypothetical protein